MIFFFSLMVMFERCFATYHLGMPFAICINKENMFGWKDDTSTLLGSHGLSGRASLTYGVSGCKMMHMLSSSYFDLSY